MHVARRKWTESGDYPVAEIKEVLQNITWSYFNA